MNRNGKRLFAIAQYLIIPVLLVCMIAGVLRSNAALELESVRLAPLEAERKEQAAQSDEQITEEEAPVSVPEAKTVKKNKNKLKDGTYTGTGQGYGGPITVEVTVKNGKIDGIKILSAPGETSPFFDRALTILPVMIQAGSANVDSVSGATFSSNGIKTAVGEALQKAGKKEKVALKPAVVTNPQPAAQDKKEETFKKPKRGWKDGKYKGTATGFGGPVRVVVTIKKREDQKDHGSRRKRDRLLLVQCTGRDTAHH